MLGYIDAITDIGIKRKDNQDNYWVSRLQIGNRELEILCVCDGMGGLTNGGIASEMVVRSVREAYLGGKAFLDLKGVLEETNKQIYNREERMGTTCTIVEVEGDFYRVCNSVRPYRWQPTRLPRPWDFPGKSTGVGCHRLL